LLQTQFLPTKTGISSFFFTFLSHITLEAGLVPAPVPPAQPLPTAVLHPERPSLKLGLDVHLEFVMAVVQRGHTSAQAPRKFTPDQLVEQVRKWVA
jgi:hypothetical protein